MALIATKWNGLLNSHYSTLAYKVPPLTGPSFQKRWYSENEEG